MTNKTITLSRELVAEAAIMLKQTGTDDAIAEDLRAALAEPVPPAGGKPDPIIAVLKGHLADGMNPMFSGGDLKHLIGLLEAGTWLQAEVERLKANSTQLATLDDQTIKQLGDKLRASQAELTKARELFRSLRLNADPALFSPGQLASVDEFISNQSAPADKCITCDGTGVDLDGAVNPDGGPSDCLECGGRGSLPNKLASADKGQGEAPPFGWWRTPQGLPLQGMFLHYEPEHSERDIQNAINHGFTVTRLYAEQPAPVALHIPDECPHMIVFDDTERDDLMFSGAGAREAALKMWEKISMSWNAHLFVRVGRNSRDDGHPCAKFAPVAVVMPFDFEHPLSKERRTVTLTKRDVFDGMEDYFYDKLSEQICQCESVGETNVVDCNCDEYVHDFEIVQACLDEVGRLNSEPKP